MNIKKPDPFYYMKNDPLLLRIIRNILLKVGFGYVTFTGEQNHLWRAAMKNSPYLFRWFGKSLSFQELNSVYRDFDEWAEASKKYKEGDKIWSFVINPKTMAMRVGFVIVRSNNPVTGIVTIVS